MSKEKILSIFIDESGDFGQFNPKHPMYYVAMVMHEQANDISANIRSLETLISNWGYPDHAIHTGPLIRKESVYYHDLRENRKALFNALYHFTRQLNIKYICPRINQKECSKKTTPAYVEFRLAYPRDYRLSQVADLICTIEMLADKKEFTVSETEFFHSRKAFKTNILKDIKKKRL